MKTIIIAILFLVSTNSFSQEIEKNRLKEIISTLASDEMKGRKVGTPENLKAAQYIAEQFKTNNLEYCTGNSYLIPFQYKGKTEYNVCGYKKGIDKDILAFGAHFDHIGETKKDVDKVYNGADDNASGVSAVIALSDYYKDKKTQYEMVFMAFNAEEVGLVGSKELANDQGLEKYNPHIKALFNFEMIGTRSAFGENKLFMTGDNRSNLDELINKNAQNSLEIVPDPYHTQQLFFRSDNVNFYKKGIVAHSFSTVDMNNQKHYHQANDEISVIDLDNLTKIVNSFALTLDKLMVSKDFIPEYSKK